jgi:hypothetical protein
MGKRINCFKEEDVKKERVVYFFEGKPKVPYEFLVEAATDAPGMSVLLLGRGKVNDSPKPPPSRGFQIGEPRGLTTAGV